MRQALGLLLGCFVAAGLIAGGWFWVSAPRTLAAAPQTIAARPAQRLTPLAQPTPAGKNEVEVPAGLSFKTSEKAPAPAIPSILKTTCANPNALGVSRVVEIDTTGG